MPNNPFDLHAIRTNALETLNAFLQKNRFCYLMPTDKTAPEDAVDLLDTHTGLRYSPQNNGLETFLQANPFVYVRQAGSKTKLATLHSATGLLWNNETSDICYSLEEGQKAVAEGNWAGLQNWQIPSLRQLQKFAESGNNPHQKGLVGDRYQLATRNGSSHDYWLTSKTATYLLKQQQQQQQQQQQKQQQQKQSSHIGSLLAACFAASAQIGNTNTFEEERRKSPRLFACHTHWEKMGVIERLIDMATRQWQLVAPNGQTFNTPNINKQWQGIKVKQLFNQLKNTNLHLRAVNNKNAVFNAALTEFSHIDYTPCRLPVLHSAQLTDPHKGLWELFGNSADALQAAGLVARDPMQDVQQRAVAIDFGTSSTVVAIETTSGGRELLRIGVHDFYQDIKPEHFENPTVLECLDFSAFVQVWKQQTYRPALNWDWMRAAHEAQTNLRDNVDDATQVARMLPRLKQWALRSAEQHRVRFIDKQQREIILTPHTEYNPVRGQALSVNAQYPFDPIELYAWFLGMAINWRGHGIFLNYHLSFPVKYPRDVKDRILASFRRGLQRSLPHSLISHYPEVLNTFEVNELANEPAAYAAAALQHLNVQPTEEGVPYAVFDFGGGTSDFDYGLLRWATEDEENQGYEQVFEHLASSGDNFLGGENLLENLVYQTFCKNLKELGKAQVQFTKPLDAAPCAGTEAFASNSQTAQTNSLKLAAKMRPFLENKESKKIDSPIKLNLLNINNENKSCTLTTDAEALEAWLETRIQNGLVAFLAELARVRSAFPTGAPVHLLLAGNGCHSRHIQKLTQGVEWKKLLIQAFGNNVPEIIVHSPLPMNEENPHAPTAKTGVALGLLRLVPGRNALLIDHLQQRHDGQAPFGWFVGRMRRGHFEPKLSPTAAYGQWHEIGPLQQGIFTLFSTTSPRAHQGMAEGDTELKMLRQTFHGAPVGTKLFARATAHNSIEMAAALSSEQIEEYDVVKLTLA